MFAWLRSIPDDELPPAIDVTLRSHSIGLHERARSRDFRPGTTVAPCSNVRDAMTRPVPQTPVGSHARGEHHEVGSSNACSRSGVRFGRTGPVHSTAEPECRP